MKTVVPGFLLKRESGVLLLVVPWVLGEDIFGFAREQSHEVVCSMYIVGITNSVL